MRFTKITAIVLALVSIFLMLAACGNTAAYDGEKEEVTKPAAETAPAKPKPKPREQTISPVSDEAGKPFLRKAKLRSQSPTT